MFIMWSFKRINSFKVFFWYVEKWFLHVCGLAVELDWKQNIPLVTWGDFNNPFYFLNTENLTWMIHVPNDPGQYWTCSISLKFLFISDKLTLKRVALWYDIFVSNLLIYFEWAVSVVYFVNVLPRFDIKFYYITLSVCSSVGSMVSGA